MKKVLQPDANILPENWLSPLHIEKHNKSTEKVHSFVLFLSEFIIDRDVKSILGRKIMQLEAKLTKPIRNAPHFSSFAFLSINRDCLILSFFCV